VGPGDGLVEVDSSVLEGETDDEGVIAEDESPDVGGGFEAEKSGAPAKARDLALAGSHLSASVSTSANAQEDIVVPEGMA